MKKPLCLLLFVLVATHLRAQPALVRSAFQVDSLWILKAFADNDGFIYVAGYEAYDLPPYQDTAHTVFKVRKYDPSGQKLWENRIASRKFLWGVQTAFANGKLFVAGTFQGKLEHRFGTLVSKGGMDIFALTIDPSGNYVISSDGSPADERLWSMTADANANLYLSGNFNKTFQLAGTTYTASVEHSFIMKTTNLLTGTFWVKYGKEMSGGIPMVPLSLRLFNNRIYSVCTNGGYTKFGSDTVPVWNSYEGSGIIWDVSGNVIGNTLEASHQGLSRFIGFVDENDRYCCVTNSYGRSSSSSRLEGFDAGNKTAWTTTLSGINSMQCLTGRTSHYYGTGSGYTQEMTVFRGDFNSGKIVGRSSILPSGQRLMNSGIDFYGADGLLLYGRFYGTTTINGTVMSTASQHTPASYVLVVNSDAITGLEDNPVSQQQTIRPNPALSSCQVMLPPGETSGHLALRSLAGAVVLSRELCGTINEIDVALLPRGVYITEIRCGTAIRIQKLVLY